MSLTLALILLLQPFDTQKAGSAERLVERLGREVATDGTAALFAQTDCAVIDRRVATPFPLPGQVLSGETTALSCRFPTSCGVTGERTVFHTRLYGAWKPAESFAMTLAGVCPQMLRADVHARLTAGQTE